ncbi:MAG: hypothetical protein F6K28_15950 [Microcoleus sp. SIO2G3]|nr:hypothetical protein [Microcoleus sp. SIO2G3]
MNLLCFECCRSTDAEFPQEQSLRVEWLEAFPTVGDLVSMGGDRDWEIIELYRYEATGLGSQVGAVYFAQVNPEDQPVPPISEWTSTQMSSDKPFVSFSAVGEPELEIGYHCLDIPPRIGERLITGEPTDHPTQMKVVELPWKVDRVDTYQPLREAPYSNIFICWCVQTKEAIAA